MIDIKELRRLAQEANEHSDDRAEILAEFYAATQSDTIIELLDRLEAAEKSYAESIAMYRKARDECDALRAKVERMEKQEPVAWLHETRRDSDVVTDAVKHVWGKPVVGALAAYSIPLYLATGAQPAPGIPEGKQ